MCGARVVGSTAETHGNARRETWLVDSWRSDLYPGDGGVPDLGCGGDRGRGGLGRSNDGLGVPWVDVGEVRRSDGRGGEIDVA
jgi:hypothetical protein